MSEISSEETKADPKDKMRKNWQIDNLDEWPEMEAIRIFRWSAECPQCEQQTPHLSYSILYEGRLCVIGDLSPLDFEILSLYPFIAKWDCNTHNRSLITNICVHCGNIQEQDLIRKELPNYAFQAFEERRIPNVVTNRKLEASVRGETKKALYLKFNSGTQLWVPKSQIHARYDSPGSFTQIFLIRNWFITKNKLTFERYNL